MSLAEAAVAIRPRSAWEGLDLGFAMGRRWFWRLWLLWALTALPLALFFFGWLGLDNWIAYVVLWWCKPLYEWMMLYWLSQRVFGAALPLTATGAILQPRRWLDLLPYLLWRRLTLHRPFTMAIGMLEGLRGKPRAQRVSLLTDGQQNMPWLTIVCVHFEGLITFTANTLLAFFVISEYSDNSFFISLMEFSESAWLSVVVLMLTWSVIAPFYVAAGFAAYLTRRTQLEAWDLELVFRQLGPRLRQARGLAVVMLVTVLMAAGGGVETANAQDEPQTDAAAVDMLDQEQARAAIDEVLSDEVFGETVTRQRWRYRGDTDAATDEIDESTPRWLAGLIRLLSLSGEIFLWLFVAAGGFMLLRYLLRLADSLQADTQQATEATAPVLIGSDEEALPDDIPSAVADLLAAGRGREALGLLYRGSLLHLQEAAGLRVPESATEGECRRLVRRHCRAPVAEYFDQLALLWMRVAYAGEQPPHGGIEQLNRQWPQVFGQPAC
ncbi:MAG: DUF4129 domain-containing protein [Wenzhouxiangellaceae bacterium]